MFCKERGYISILDILASNHDFVSGRPVDAHIGTRFDLIFIGCFVVFITTSGILNFRGFNGRGNLFFVSSYHLFGIFIFVIVEWCFIGRGVSRASVFKGNNHIPVLPSHFFNYGNGFRGHWHLVPASSCDNLTRSQGKETVRSLHVSGGPDRNRSSCSFFHGVGWRVLLVY